VWRFTKKHWKTLTERFPSNSVPRMLEGITSLDSPTMVTDAAEFLAAHPVLPGERQIAQHLERQAINAALRTRESSRLTSSLSNAAGLRKPGPDADS